MGNQVSELCNVETNYLHFVGRVQQYVVALLWNPPEPCGTFRMDRLSYHLSKRSPRHSKENPGNLDNLEIHLF